MSGLYEEQLKQRKNADAGAFSEGLDSIASAVMGKSLNAALNSGKIAESAADEILKFYHCKIDEFAVPTEITKKEEQLAYRMRPFGIKNRNILLDEGWYSRATGAMLGTLKEDGSAIVLIPGRFFGYKFLNLKTGRWTAVNKRTDRLIDREALCFYKPLPQRALSVSDLIVFMMEQLSFSDIALYLVLMAVTTLLGMVPPMFTKMLFGDVLEFGDTRVLLALAGFMLFFYVSSLSFSAFQSLITQRIQTKQSVAVQAAVMNRIMDLPAGFFKNYSSGELTEMSNHVQNLCTTLFSTIGMTGLTSVFSLVYIGQIFVYARPLVLPSVIITALTLALSLATAYEQTRVNKKSMEISAKTSGLTYAMISGIQKIKLAGAERRIFGRWAKQYAKKAELIYNPPIFLRLSSTINLAITLMGALVLNYIAVTSQISVSDYYAFNAAYGMVAAAFASLVNIASQLAQIRPVLDMARPIMETEPEMAENKTVVTKLSGDIELSHVYFKYNEDMPYVLEDFSLNVKKGEYLAITGVTGCGKSTLFRLLLGFEKPEKGSIFYDKKDTRGLDFDSVRRNIGVVLQDGKLFSGDIFSNIVITAPYLTRDDAWKAAEIAQVADDIRAMPMGMNTVISEGQGGISGGQRQRLMIARAVAPGPKVLMFDEATSALDNITQKKVTDAIDSLKCTRIVIAHRLSTIKNADRIIYLSDGKIEEEGTYEELIAKDGEFAKLIRRQRPDISD